MKYAITGHTKGIGKAFASLPHVKDNFVGFSRGNGYNIKEVEDRRKIIREAIDCDVFINNAYQLYYQTDMLYELHKKWQKDSTKIIINIGSNTTHGIKSFPHVYTAHKASLETASIQLNNANLCKVVLLKFGWVGTEKILTYMKPTTYIPVDECAEIINQAVEWAHKYRVTTMTILPEADMKRYDTK